MERHQKAHAKRLRRAAELGIQEEKDARVKETRLRQLAEVTDEELLRRAAAAKPDEGREDWARLDAEEQGYRLVKSEGGDPQAFDFGHYAIIDNETGKAVEEDLDIDDVDCFLSGFYEEEKLTEADRMLFDFACSTTTTKVGQDGVEFWDQNDIVNELVKMGKTHERAQILANRAVTSAPQQTERGIRH